MADYQAFFEENCSPEECLVRIQSLFNDENTNTESLFDLQYLDQLLAKLHLQSPESHLINKRVASFVRDVATFYPDAVCHLLLIHLSDLSDPIPFVSIMASLFCFAVPSLVVEAFKQLKLLPERDNRLLLPVIGAMADLPLPDNLLQELCILAEDAIQVLDEIELPALFRTLLRSLCPSRAERAILKLRDEMTNISNSSIALLVEVMWEILPSSSGAAEVLLDQIFREQEFQSLRQPPLTDLAVVLILTSNIGALKFRARALFDLWLKQGTFPFAQLELVLSLRRSNEIWERMIPAIWRLCLWTLETLADTDTMGPCRVASLSQGHSRMDSGTISSGVKNHVYLTNKDGLCRTVHRLCACMPSVRETIVSSLLSQCYTDEKRNSTSSGRKSHNTCAHEDRDGAWLMHLPPLGGACKAYGIISMSAQILEPHHLVQESSNRDERDSVIEKSIGISPSKNRWNLGPSSEIHLNRKAQAVSVLAASLLESLAGCNAEIGANVLSSIMDRLTPSSSSHGGTLLLPPAAVLHCLMGCIVSVTCSSPQIENTVFIVIQKLLASSHSAKDVGEECNLMRILSSTSFSSSLSATIGAASTKITLKLLDRLSPTCLQLKYSPGTVGCVLSGHLLLREAPHPLSATDFRAVVTWLTRAVTRFSDLSIACALDVLVACIRRRETNRRGSSVQVRGSVSMRDEEHREQMGLLKAAADLCLQRIFKMKALVHREEILSTDCFIASVIRDGDGGHAIRYPEQGEGEGAKGVALHWNVAALSANLVLSEVSGERHRFDESHRAVDRSDSISAVCSAAFWVLQRAAALHSTLSRAHTLHADPSDGGSSRSDSLNVMPCIGIVMSRSELDTPERVPWMSSSSNAEQHNQAGRIATTGSTSTPKNKGRVTRRSAEVDVGKIVSLPDVFPGFSVWACSAVDGIESLSFTRSLSLSSLGALRLAWERAMCAAVLLEHSPPCDSLYGTPSEALKVLLSLSRLLCQMHMSRYMLRGTMAGSPLLSQGRGGIASSGRYAQTRFDKHHCSPSSTVGHAGDYTSEANFKKAMRKAEVVTSCHADNLATQRVVVQNLLNRVEGLISDETVLLSMSLLLTDDITTCIPSTPASVLSPADVPTPSPPCGSGKCNSIPTALLTDAGLAVVSCYAVRLLTGQLQSSPSNADAVRGNISNSSNSSVMRRPDELFYSLLEVTAHTAAVHPVDVNVQSTSSSSTNSTTNVQGDASHGNDQSNAISLVTANLLCSFISLAPLLSREEDFLRKASILPDSFTTVERNLNRSTELKRKKINDAYAPELIAAQQVHTTQSDSSSSSSERKEIGQNVELHSVMGATLDRAGCAVLLMSSYVLLDFTVNEVRRRTGGDIGEVTADPFLVHVAQAMMVNSRQDTLHMEGESHSSSNNAAEECETMSIMRMYDIIEKQVLATQDVTVALGGLRLLSSLSSGSMLYRRQASVAWALLRTLHTQHTNLSTDLLSHCVGVDAGERGYGIPGIDDLWEHLASFICTSRNPSIDHSILELQGDGSTGFFATIGDTALTAAISAFRTGLGLPSLSSSARGNDASLTANGIPSFRMMWTFWWGAEEPEARVHGVVALLADIFRYHLLPSAAESASARDGRQQRESAGKERKISAVSQAGSAGAMSWLSYNFSSKDTSAFHALTYDNLDALFTLAVSTFPALFLLAKPQPCDSTDAHEGPYRSLTAVVKAFIWLLEQLEIALEDGSQLYFLRSHCVFCVRMTRAVISCVEGMLVGVVAWRSEQVLPPNRNIREDSSDPTHASTARSDAPPIRPSLSRSNCADKGSDDGENEGSGCDRPNKVYPGPVEFRDGQVERDSGSVEHLADLLDWSQALAQRVIRFAETLKDRMLSVSSAIKVSGNLSHAVPQLQFAAERLAVKVLRTAKAHSVQLNKAENMFADRSSASKNAVDSQGGDGLNNKRKKRVREDVVVMWSDDVMQREAAFTAAHKRQLLHPADDSLWCSVLADGQDSSRSDNHQQRHSLDSSTRREEVSSEDSDDESASAESEEGQFVARARKGSSSPGWGLYHYQEEEEVNEDDEIVAGPSGQDSLGSQLDSGVSCRDRSLFHEQLGVEVGSPNLSLQDRHTSSEMVPGLSPQGLHNDAEVAKFAVEECVPQSSRKRSKAAKGDSMLTASTPVSALKTTSHYT